MEVHDHRTSTPAAAPSRPSFSLFQTTHQREPTQATKFELFRIVLAPNPSSLWTQLGIQERKDAEKLGPLARAWTEDEMVEMEATILVRPFLLQTVLTDY